MTFQTDKKNEFKKDPLRGLEYNTSGKPFNWVKAMIGLILATMVISLVFKMCTDKPEIIPLQVLNADRR